MFNEYEKQLKQCKLCGSDAILQSTSEGNVYAICCNPFCKFHIERKSWVKGNAVRAIAFWNKRMESKR